MGGVGVGGPSHPPRRPSPPSPPLTAMQKQTLATLLLLAALPATAGCIVHIGGGWTAPSSYQSSSRLRLRGDGVAEQVTRVVVPFQAVENTSFFDLRIQVGGEPALTLHGDRNILPHLRTEVVDGSLRIRMDEGRYSPREHCWIEIGVAKLEGLSQTGSGDALVTGVVGETFSLSITGSGDVEMEGQVENLAVNLTGSADADLEHLAARTVLVSLTGSGDVTTTVGESLTVSLTGSGDVGYRGDPQVVSSVSGSGDVRRLRP